jgi:hypothetical protein
VVTTAEQTYDVVLGAGPTGPSYPTISAVRLRLLEAFRG